MRDQNILGKEVIKLGDFLYTQRRPLDKHKTYFICHLSIQLQLLSLYFSIINKRLSLNNSYFFCECL